MAYSPALNAYLGATSLLDGWVARKLDARSKAGKEDIERIEERFGHAGVKRPEGPLIWFHAASVGESLSILELIREIIARYPGLNLLVTTGTRTSAQLLSARLPGQVIHQYVPVDTKDAVQRFLDHWQPDLALWTESELWPRLVTQTASRGTKMILINGRISQRSSRRWRFLPGMARHLIGCFCDVLVQDEDMARRYAAIGADADHLHVTGSLKEGAQPLPVDEELLSTLQKAVGQRFVWLAASTHEGEEEIILDAHKALRRRVSNLLLILAPRHPERGDEVAELISATGMSMARRSGGGGLVKRTSVYLADTLGEMGLWYRLSPISFVGGSLTLVGGHNPFEPAALGSAILHGPHIDNFADIYKRLSDAKGSVEVTDEQTLAAAVEMCLRPDRAAALAQAAWDVSSDGSGVTETVMNLIAPHLDQAVAAPDGP